MKTLICIDILTMSATIVGQRKRQQINRRCNGRYTEVYIKEKIHIPSVYILRDCISY